MGRCLLLALVAGFSLLRTWVEGKEHDIGHLFHTWFKALGIDRGLTSYDNGGQPLPIAHEECAAVKEILA